MLGAHSKAELCAWHCVYAYKNAAGRSSLAL